MSKYHYPITTLLILCAFLFFTGCSGGDSNPNCPCNSLQEPSSTIQTYIISGYVKSGGTPVQNAQVTIVRKGEISGTTLMTDAEGYFIFTNLPSDLYSITIYADGYIEQKLERTSFSNVANPPELLNIELVPVSP